MSSIPGSQPGAATAAASSYHIFPQAELSDQNAVVALILVVTAVAVPFFALFTFGVGTALLIVTIEVLGYLILKAIYENGSNFDAQHISQAAASLASKSISRMFGGEEGQVGMTSRKPKPAAGSSGSSSAFNESGDQRMGSRQSKKAAEAPAKKPEGDQVGMGARSSKLVEKGSYCPF